MQVECGHYNLYEIESFEFNECVAPSFGVKTKLHGTIYPRCYNAEESKDITTCPVTLFGFQITQAFRMRILVTVQIISVQEFTSETVTHPIFKKFDAFMYQARLEYKKKGNASMA